MYDGDVVRRAYFGDRCPDSQGPLDTRCNLRVAHAGRHTAPTIDGSVSWIAPYRDGEFRCGAIRMHHPQVWCEWPPQHEGPHRHLDGEGYEWNWAADSGGGA